MYELIKQSRNCDSAYIKSHHPEGASSSDFKDAATPRFGHSDVVYDLFIEACVLHLIAFLSNFSNISNV